MQFPMDASSHNIPAQFPSEAHTSYTKDLGQSLIDLYGTVDPDAGWMSRSTPFSGMDGYFSASSDLQYDVDLSILDYLVHCTTKVIFRARKQETRDEGSVDWDKLKCKAEMVNGSFILLRNSLPVSKN
jgi:hypothetical protein